MDEEAAARPIFDFESVKLCFRRNLVGCSYGLMGFENAETVVKLDIEGIFPTDVAHVFNWRILRRSE